MAYRVSTMAGMLAAVLAGALADCLLQAFFAPSPVLTVLLMLFALSMLGVYLFFNASQKPRIGGTAGLHALIDTSLKEAAGGRSLFAGALRRFVSRKQSREMADMMNQLHNSRIFLKNIINHVADPIFVKDRQHRLVEGNSAFWRLMGKAEADVLGKTDYSFFPKDEADVFWEKDEEVFTTAKENINIEKLTDAGGGIHTLSTKKACFTGPDGERTLVGIIRDITELKQAQDKLKESDEARLKSIMAHSGRPVYMKDREGRYLQVNDDFLAMLQCAEKDVLGKTDFDLFPDEYAQAYHRNDMEVIEKASAVESEETIPHHDGMHIHTSVRFPLYDANDQIYAICGISTDITERKQSEEKLKRTLEELQQANADLERFAYICSHDLQEPLRMISNYTDRLAKHMSGGLDEKGRHYMKYITDGAANARALISDVLTYAHASMEPDRLEAVDCNAMLEVIKANLDTAIQESKAAITSDTLPTVMGHPTQILQLFQNLLSNAVKFRGQQPPVIHIGVERKDGRYEFSIRDNGIGIPAEYRDKVFIMFQRLVKKGEYPGTGIGLAICKKIVEQYGGKIWIDTPPEGGCIFFFTLPAAIAKEKGYGILQKTG